MIQSVKQLCHTYAEPAVARVKGDQIDKQISLANGATVIHRSVFDKVVSRALS